MAVAPQHAGRQIGAHGGEGDDESKEADKRARKRTGRRHGSGETGAKHAGIFGFAAGTN
jgi:hypothetical protein